MLRSTRIRLKFTDLLVIRFSASISQSVYPEEEKIAFVVFIFTQSTVDPRGLRVIVHYGLLLVEVGG